MRGPATTTIRSPGSRRGQRYAATTRRSNGPPTPDPPTLTTQTFSSSR